MQTGAGSQQQAQPSRTQAPTSLPDSAAGVGGPHSTRRANPHLRRPRLLGNRPPTGGGTGWSGAPGEEGGPCPAPTTPIGAHRPSSAGSNRRQPPAKLQLTKNLKANSPGPLPVPGVASATSAHAGRRPGSEDAGRRARAGRGMGVAGGDGGGGGRRLRSPRRLLPAGWG